MRTAMNNMHCFVFFAFVFLYFLFLLKLGSCFGYWWVLAVTTSAWTILPLTAWGWETSTSDYLGLGNIHLSDRILMTAYQFFGDDWIFHFLVRSSIFSKIFHF